MPEIYLKRAKGASVLKGFANPEGVEGLGSRAGTIDLEKGAFLVTSATLLLRRA